jgi:hypothetical protein
MQSLPLVDKANIGLEGHKRRAGGLGHRGSARPPPGDRCGRALALNPAVG